MWRRRGETWPCGWWMLSSDGGMDTTGSPAACVPTSRVAAVQCHATTSFRAVRRQADSATRVHPTPVLAVCVCVRRTRNETSTLQPYRYNTTPLTNNAMTLLLEQVACNTKQLNKKNKTIAKQKRYRIDAGIGANPSAVTGVGAPNEYGIGPSSSTFCRTTK